MRAIPSTDYNEWCKLLKYDNEKALNYYFKNILPLIVQNITDEQKPPISCEILFSLMGFSPETTVLSTVSMKPDELVILTGDNTKQFYNLIMKFFIEYKILEPHQIRLEKIDINDLSQIYSTIVNTVAKLQSGNVFVDITGGKKIMSASAAQAAWEVDASLCYIEGDYDPVIRRPKIGTEKLILLDNPSLEKAKMQRRNGLNAWKVRNFSLAGELFQKSRNMNKDHLFEDVAIPLTRFFDALYNFNLSALESHIKEIQKLNEIKYLSPILLSYGINKCLSVFTSDPGLVMTTEN